MKGGVEDPKEVVPFRKLTGVDQRIWKDYLGHAEDPYGAGNCTSIVALIFRVVSYYPTILHEHRSPKDR